MAKSIAVSRSRQGDLSLLNASIQSTSKVNVASLRVYILVRTREASILGSLDHYNILAIEDVLTDGRRVYMVLELAAGGSLYDRLASNRRMTEADTRTVFRQLCEGVTYLVRKKSVSLDCTCLTGNSMNDTSFIAI